MTNKVNTTKANEAVSVEQQMNEILKQVKTGNVYKYYNAAIDKSLPQEEQEKIFLDWLKIFAETKVFQLMKKDKSELTRADLEYIMDCCRNTLSSSSDKVTYIRQGWVADFREVFNKYLAEIIIITSSVDDDEEDYYDEETAYQVIYAVNDFKAYELMKNQYKTESNERLITDVYVSIQKLKEVDNSTIVEDKMRVVDVVLDNPTICDLGKPESLLSNMIDYFNSQSSEVKKEIKNKINNQSTSDFIKIIELIIVFTKEKWTVNIPDQDNEKEYFHFACELFSYLFDTNLKSYESYLEQFANQISE